MRPDSSPSVAGPESAIIETLAYRLECAERGLIQLSAQQYRRLVVRLGQALNQAGPEVQIAPLLDGFPAAGEVYENLNYELAGLCRSPLEAALGAELQARATLAKAGRTPLAS